MDIQLIIVIIIGIALAAKMGYEIYKLIFVKKNNPYCGGCTMCETTPKAKKKV